MQNICHVYNLYGIDMYRYDRVYNKIGWIVLHDIVRIKLSRTRANGNQILSGGRSAHIVALF